MKSKTSTWYKLIFVVALALFAAGCSDGALPSNSDVLPELGAPTPLIAKFFATPTEIMAGETTTLHWTVSDADSIEIKPVVPEGAAPVNFHVESKELVSEAVVEGLTVTTDFVITATKSAVAATEGEGSGEKEKAKAQTLAPEKPGEPAKPSGVSAATKTITVVVIPKAVLVATMTAEPTKVRSGEQVILRWNLTPAEKLTTTVTTDTNEPIVAFTKCDGSKEEILAGEVAATVPAVGCAIVTPATTTVYTITGKTPDGVEGSSSVTVNVIESGLIANIKVNGSNNAKITNFSEPVTVEWSADPATAAVTITSDPAVECTPALGKMEKAKGSTSCVVQRDTAFKMTAELSGMATVTAEAYVTSGSSSRVVLDVVQKWAFVGEMVSIDLAVSKSSDPSAIQSVTVNDTAIAADALESLKKSGSVRVSNVKVARKDVEVKVTSSSSEETTYYPVKSVAFNLNDLDDGSVEVTGVAIDRALKHRYAGVMMKECSSTDTSCGMARVNIDGAMKQFSAVDKIKGLHNLADLWNDNFFKNVIKKFPVVVAAREGKDGEIYAGTTGVVVRSTDNGATWQDIWVGRVQAAKGYKGDPSHPTCGYDATTSNKQKVQGGVKPQYDGAFISLTQVCDIVALPSGGVVIATDVGTRTLKNVDDAKIDWLGKSDKEIETSPTYGVVVNDLTLAMNGDIFAAAANGVFVSKDSGVTWKKFGSGLPEGSVFAVSTVVDNVYVGTSTGLFTATASKGEFKAVTGLSAPVVSLASGKDSSDSTVILAGTDAGLKISRDNGASWSSIELGTKTPVRAIAFDSTTNSISGTTYGVMLGTDKGEFSALFDLTNVNRSVVQK